MKRDYFCIDCRTRVTKNHQKICDLHRIFPSINKIIISKIRKK